jgi:siroheme synthase (precorrin-2 oxidase/ferrochelatase)
VVGRGDLQIAISTNGQSPALAQRLRQELEHQYGADYADWIQHLGAIRRDLFALDMDAETRRLQVA